MKHIFMDTDVVIDFLANRQPFSLDAARFFNMSVEGRIKSIFRFHTIISIMFFVSR
jgi:hypothetical protein